MSQLIQFTDVFFFLALNNIAVKPIEGGISVCFSNHSTEMGIHIHASNVLFDEVDSVMAQTHIHSHSSNFNLAY